MNTYAKVFILAVINIISGFMVFIDNHNVIFIASLINVFTMVGIAVMSGLNIKW